MPMNDEVHQEALILIGEMIDMTQRIVAASSEPDSDLLDLSKGLDERLNALKAILPSPRDLDGHPAGAGDKAGQLSVGGMAVLERLKVLNLCVDKCVQVLMRHKVHVEKELISARQSQKAFQAYGASVRRAARRGTHSLKNRAG
jgi:hypothetical protein